MVKYRDFDLFFQEQKRELLIFKLFGKNYTLPPALPATLMVKILRSKKEDEISADEVLEICNGMLGAAQFEDLMAKGVDIEQLENIIRWSVSIYSGGKSEFDPLTPEAKKADPESSEEDPENFPQEK